MNEIGSLISLLGVVMMIVAFVGLRLDSRSSTERDS
jgi:hypothetical protein